MLRKKQQHHNAFCAQCTENKRKNERSARAVIYKHARYADVTHIDSWNRQQNLYLFQRKRNVYNNNNHNAFKYKTKEKRHTAGEMKTEQQNTALNIIKWDARLIQTIWMNIARFSNRIGCICRAGLESCREKHLQVEIDVSVLLLLLFLLLSLSLSFSLFPLLFF